MDGTVRLVIDWYRFLLDCARVVRLITEVAILMGVDHAVIPE